MAIGRITLQSTSRMSLNDRFTGLRGDTTDGSVAAGIQQRRQAVNASRKNQRLAQQMENRPAVIAALRSSFKPGARRARGVRGGLLRGARGARGVIRVGGVVRGGRLSNAGPSTSPKASTMRGRGGGSFRGRGRGGGSVRGINFSTGTPLRLSTSRGNVMSAYSTARLGDEPVAVPVKQRLAVQSRLSQPVSTRGRGGARGMRGARGPPNFRGRLSTRGRGNLASGRGFQTRTFRGRGGRGGGGRGPYSQHWQNGQ